MAWSPLAGGKLFGAEQRENLVLLETMGEVATRMSTDIVGVMYAWLLKHPVGIMPIIGSSRIDRVAEAVDALELEMTDQDWFLIYIQCSDASTGYALTTAL